MGVFRQKSGMHPFFLSASYKNVSLMKHAVSLKGTNIFP